MLHLGLLALLTAGAAGPERAIASPDGTLQVVIESPEGDGTWRYGFHPRERTFARIEDSATGRVIARLDLGWSVVAATISPDSRTLTVLCFGYRSQHAHEALPREVAIFDLATGAERGRVPLPYRVPELADPIPDPDTRERPDHNFIPSDDGRTVFVLAGRERPRSGPPFTPELMVIDVESASLRERIALPLGSGTSCARLSPTRDRVLLPFATGKIYNLLAVGVADGAMETVRLDTSASFELILNGRVEFLVTRPPGKHFWTESPTLLTRFDREQPGWTLELPPNVEPARLSADGRRLALRGRGMYFLVDVETGSEVRRMKAERRLKFERDIPLDEFLAGEPGFAAPPRHPPGPDVASLSTWAERPVCPSLGRMEQGVLEP